MERELRGTKPTAERLVRGAFGIALALLGLLGALSYLNALRQEDYRARVGHTEAVISTLHSLLFAITDLESSQRRYTILGDDSLLGPLNEAQAQVGRLAGELLRLTADKAAQQRRLDVLLPLVERRIAISNRVVRLRRAGGFAAARAAMASGEGARVHDHIWRMVAELEDAEQALRRSREAEARSVSVLTRAGIVAGSALAVGVVAVALSLIGRAFGEIRRAELDLRSVNDQLEARVRQRTEELARGHENVRLLVLQAPLCIAMFDREMRYLATSRRWIEEYGRGHADLIGRYHYDVLPDLPERYREAHRRGQAGEVTEVGEDSWVQGDGQRQWLRWAVHPWRDAQGEIGGIIISTEDITPRKQAEAQRDELTQQRQLALRAAHLGWWHYDPSTKVASWDERYREIFGVSGSERPNEEILARLHPDDLPSVWAAVEAALDPVDPQPYATQYRVNHPDGSVRWVEAHGIATFEGDGVARRASSFVGTVQDVTERKAAEDAIRSLNLQLEQRVAERTAELQAKNRELESFTYSVSHDLKAPLRGIEGYSQLLVEEYGDKLDEEGRGFIENVRKSVLRMDRLIGDLLAYSRVERRTLEVVTVDLRELAQELLAERADELCARGLEVGVELPPGAAVSADREGLSMALRNLLDNALKFTGGVPKPEVAITGTCGPTSFTIGVRDNGAGFEMKFHDRIFEIFQRLHGPDAFPGTGIGLAMVRKAMERMGGRAWAESEPGKGATFFLELPRQP